MGFFTWEHSKCRAYFVLYGSVVIVATAYLLVASPREQRLENMVFTLAGLGSWTAIEYVMHRFVLHGFQPFRQWHAEHHHCPTKMIRGTIILSGILISILVIFPALLLGDLWRACALSLGLLTGYFGYAITHHAIHHWRIENAWLKARKRWHVQYHHHSEQPGCYGVTSSFWDNVFGSTPRTVVSKSC